MPINSEHPSYSEKSALWTRCFNCFQGEDAVKAAGVAYLPMLGGQDQKEYDAYKMRSMFYNATARTVKGLVGCLTRKDPVLKVDTSFEEWLKNVSGNGMNIIDFIKAVTENILLTDRAVILVDRRLNAEVTELPFLSLFSALDLVSWTDDGSRYVLREYYKEVSKEDKYKIEMKQQFRELVVENNVYVVNIWRKVEGPVSSSDQSEYRIVSSVTPTFRGRTLSEIPIVLCSSSGVSSAFGNPVLLDLVNVNLSHYRTSADLEHGRHFTALPTPYVTGVPPDAAPVFKIGSESAWVIADPAANVGFLEFSGAGLAALERAIEHKESVMAVLGAKILQDQRKQVEAAETARIHQSGESSVLSSIASSIDGAIEKALSLAHAWQGLSAEVECKVNRDFIDASMAPQDVTALVSAWQQGALSLETLVYNFKRGELLADDDTIEDEVNRINAERDEAIARGLGSSGDGGTSPRKKSSASGAPNSGETK